MTVAVLFARRDSIYKSIPGVDVYDEDRDARTFYGHYPVIAHPPCRAWGRLRAFAKPQPHEKDLARFAVNMVRQNGGVLEHPAHSLLWPDMSLPSPGTYDQFGGWTLPVVQYWWGHRAMKATFLYIVGVRPSQLPEMPLAIGDSPCVVETTSGSLKKRLAITKEEREATPEQFARWLIDLACRASTHAC